MTKPLIGGILFAAFSGISIAVFGIPIGVAFSAGLLVGCIITAILVMI